MSGVAQRPCGDGRHLAPCELDQRLASFERGKERRKCDFEPTQQFGPPRISHANSDHHGAFMQEAMEGGEILVLVTITAPVSTA